MLRFALVVALLGLAACALAATWVADAAVLAHSPSVYYALFISVFVSFVPAVWCHPARTVVGAEASVGWRPVLRTAPAWAMALAFVCWITLFALFWIYYPGGEFEVTQSSLLGRPDRQRLLVAFFAVFHSTAALIASSGLRSTP